LGEFTSLNLSPQNRFKGTPGFDQRNSFPQPLPGSAMSASTSAPLIAWAA
jgi:hypothetical protein